MSGWTKKAKLRGLVMTRKEGERVTINNGELIVEVVQVRGRLVRLVFSASKDISIRRTETLQGAQDEALTAITEQTSAGE